MKKVAIVGRPNVGKSTLFNRLSKERISIIDSTRGVTRDRIYNKVEWLGKKFILIDTGGIEENSDLPFIDKITLQTNIAINEADIVLFLVSICDGIVYDDEYIAKILKKTKKEVILVPNFYDTQKYKDKIYDFYSLGFETIIPISSAHGNGISDLLKYIINKLPKETTKNNDNIIKINIIGKPNVGKSSLINAILNKERTIVSEVKGTTRENISIPFKYNKNEFIIVDTAGIKRKINDKLDKFSNLRSIYSVEDADINLVVIDASEKIHEHDKRITSYALDSKNGIIIVVNKWDKIKKNTNTQKEYEKEIYEKFKYMKYAKIVFISALYKKNIDKLFSVIEEVIENSKRRIKTVDLNRVLQEALILNSPPIKNKKKLKIYFGTQVSVKPTTFVIFVNNKKLIHFSYKRYLDNKIRENFSLEGIPINIIFRSKGE